jgi:hypothetical protein
MMAANSVRGLTLTPQLVQAFRLDQDAAASEAPPAAGDADTARRASLTAE